MINSPESYLNENGIFSERIGKDIYLNFLGKRVLRPRKPSECYKLLIKEFGIIDERFKNITP